ncbi:hypothetical protein AOLI_G00045480 [Acnodon oligacanthus]
MNKEKNKMPSHSETSTRGNPSQMTSSEKLECLRDMMGILSSLSDEEWQSLMQGMEYNHKQKKSKLEFALLCTKIVTNVSISVNSSTPTLTEEPRTGSVPPENTEQTKGKRKAKVKHTNQSTADMERGLTDDLKTPLSDERSSADLSAVTSHDLEKIFYEVKMAMRDAICRVALGKASSSESSMGNPLFSPLAKEALKALSARSKRSPSTEISTVIPSASVSQLDQLTLTCTNDIVHGIVKLYHADVSQPKPCTSVGSSEISLASHQEICQVMQELEKLVTISRSSSEECSPSTDQQGTMSVPAESVSNNEEAVLNPHPSSELTEGLVSNQFQDNMTQFVSDILTKTEEKLSLETFKDFKTESSSASGSSSSPSSPHSSSSSSSMYVHETTTCIVTVFLKWFKKLSSSDHSVSDDFRKPPLSKRYKLSAHKIYRGVQKRVFEFLLSLQRSHFKEPDSETQCLLNASPQVTKDKRPPTVQEGVDTCSDEATYKILELYKDQEVLAKAVDVISDTEHKKASPRTDPSSQIHLDPDMWTSSSSTSSERMIAVLNAMDSLDESSVLCSDSPAVLIALDEFSAVSSTTRLIASDTSEGERRSPYFSKYKKMQNFHAFFTNFLPQHCSLKFKAKKVFPLLDGYTAIESAPLTLDAALLLNEKDLSASLTSTASDGVFQIERPDSDAAGNNVSTPVRDAAVSTTESSAESEKINDRVVEIFISEDGTIYERQGPTAGPVEATNTLFQENSGLTQLENVIPDETIHSCAPATTGFTANFLWKKKSGPSDVCLSSSDSAPESSQMRKPLLRDSVLFTSSLVDFFIEESTKHFLLRFSSNSQTESPGAGSSQVTSTAFSDRVTPHSGAETQLQNLIAVQSADPQHVFSDAENCFIKTFVDKVIMGALHQTTCHSQANSSVVEKTEANVSINVEESLPTRRDPSLLNHSSCLDKAPGDMQKSRRIHFGVKGKFPFISFGFKKKKENKLNPLRKTSDSPQSISTSGETSRREREGCSSSSKEPPKFLLRIFSAISKALRNSFQPKST